jgi:hypothetical protein
MGDKPISDFGTTSINPNIRFQAIAYGDKYLRSDRVVAFAKTAR